MESKQKTIFLFDVDGTLVECGQKIEEESLLLLRRIKSRVTVGLVSGASLHELESQLGNVLYELDYLFTENGIVSYHGKELIECRTIQDYLGEEKVQKLINFCLEYISNLWLPFKRGNFIDFRTGIINVSPIGRSCSLTERNLFVEFEKNNKIREKLVKALKEKFGDWGLQFAIGGLIGIDIYPTGWDKTLSLQHLTGFDVIHFFGDRTLPGENDYEIYENSRTIGHRTSGPKHTALLVDAVLENMNHACCKIENSQK